MTAHSRLKTANNTDSAMHISRAGNKHLRRSRKGCVIQLMHISYIIYQFIHIPCTIYPLLYTYMCTYVYMYRFTMSYT